MHLFSKTKSDNLNVVHFGGLGYCAILLFEDFCNPQNSSDRTGPMSQEKQTSLFSFFGKPKPVAAPAAQAAGATPLATLGVASKAVCRGDRFSSKPNRVCRLLSGLSLLFFFFLSSCFPSAVLPLARLAFTEGKGVSHQQFRGLPRLCGRFCASSVFRALFSFSLPVPRKRRPLISL